MGGLRQRYIGSISCEEQAAKVYDYYAILSHGRKAKTNFSYTVESVRKMVEEFDLNFVVNSSYLMKEKDE